MFRKMKRQSMVVMFELAIWLIGCINIAVLGITEINRSTTDSVIMIIVGAVLTKTILTNIDNIVIANQMHSQIILLVTLLVMVANICTDVIAIIYGGFKIILIPNIIASIVILVCLIKNKPYIEMRVLSPYSGIINGILDSLDGFMNKHEE